MLIFDIIKKILINIITPPEAGNRRFRASNIRKLVKSPNEPLEEPLIESHDDLQQNLTVSMEGVEQSSN
jgi:hypothetical protein